MGHWDGFEMIFRIIAHCHLLEQTNCSQVFYEGDEFIVLLILLDFTNMLERRILISLYN